MLLINPNAGFNRNIPNVALGYAAAYYKNLGVIDLNTKLDPPARYLDIKAELVGISTQTRTLGEAKRIKAEYNKKYPGISVKSITGFIDIQCCYPFLAMEDDIKFEKPFSDELPFPRYESFDSFDIFQKNWSQGKWEYAIMTSLGCPFGCIFCSSRNRIWRARTPENCYKELKRAREKWAIRSFCIIDDCFNVDKDRVYEFCRLVAPLNLKWFCANGFRADLFDAEMAREIKNAGCQHVSFGVESTDGDVLKKIQKGETLEQIDKAITSAARYGLGVAGFFILGLPGSSYETDIKSLVWAMRKNITPHFSFYVPEEEKNNTLFCGEGAVPKATTYPSHLQMKIYNETLRFKDTGKSLSGILKNLFTRIYIVARYDNYNIPIYFINLLEYVLKRILRPLR